MQEVLFPGEEIFQDYSRLEQDLVASETLSFIGEEGRSGENRVKVSYQVFFLKSCRHMPSFGLVLKVKCRDFLFLFYCISFTFCIRI